MPEPDPHRAGQHQPALANDAASVAGSALASRAACRMHQLLLLRHAKSSRDDPKMADLARPLNKRGRRGAGTMRKAMQDLGLTPDMVLVSPSRRTLETLAALEPWDDTPLVEQVETLYLASLPQLLDILRGVNETVRSVMLIGHNPGMHELAMLLSGTSAANEARIRLASGFPTAALAEFAVATQWRQLDATGTRLVRFLTPRDPSETMT
jgi:phosphohistidine phosphatase